MDHLFQRLQLWRGNENDVNIMDTFSRGIHSGPFPRTLTSTPQIQKDFLGQTTSLLLLRPPLLDNHSPNLQPFLTPKMLNLATCLLLVSITAMNSTLFFTAFRYNESPRRDIIHLPKSEQEEATGRLQVRARTRSRRRPRRGPRSKS